ncbi:MAG: hypothetical protein RLZZ623_445 [Actinomycetota bacterium]
MTEPVRFRGPLVDTDPYDEFAFIAENAAEMGVEWPGALTHVRRDSRTLGSGQQLSLIRWGDGPAEIVFLHGGGQNAHTWDSVIVALGRPAIAIDLPGHGHSDRRSDGDHGPWQNALAVAELLELDRAAVGVPPVAPVLVGMSLGGATTIRLAATRADLFRAAVVVDVTPQVNDAGRAWTPEQRGSVALVGGPPTYESWDAIFDATMATSPKRTEAQIRRGVRHNAVRLEDGRWAWRYELSGDPGTERTWVDFTPMWDDVASITIPTMLVVGGDSVFVLPEDVDQFRRLLPSARVESVPGSGHAVQSDQPAALVALLLEVLAAESRP